MWFTKHRIIVWDHIRMNIIDDECEIIFILSILESYKSVFVLLLKLRKCVYAWVVQNMYVVYVYSVDCFVPNLVCFMQ